MSYLIKLVEYLEIEDIFIDPKAEQIEPPKKVESIEELADVLKIEFSSLREKLDEISEDVNSKKRRKK